MTHYDVLEISPQASPEVVRAAYRSLIQRFHPDRHPGDAAVAARAAAITLAYEVLSDAGRRAEYDRQQAPRPAPAAARAARPDRRQPAARAWGAGSSWWLWLPLVAGVVWGAVWLATPKSSPAGEYAALRQAFTDPGATEARRRELHARKEALARRSPEVRAQMLEDDARDLERRTMELTEGPLVVRPQGVELSIPRLRLVLGSFEAARQQAHIRRHRERLLAEIAQRLAQADAKQLAGPQGEGYLKAQLLDALATGLGTNPAETFPSTWSESPGRDGVVEVLLPAGYALKLN